MCRSTRQTSRNEGCVMFVAASQTHFGNCAMLSPLHTFGSECTFFVVLSMLTQHFVKHPVIADHLVVPCFLKLS